MNKTTTKATVDTGIKAQMMLNAFADRCERECPATQKAIDDMAAEFRDGRAAVIAFLRSEAVNPERLCEFLLVHWARVNLALATGKTRDEWLDL